MDNRLVSFSSGPGMLENRTCSIHSQGCETQSSFMCGHTVSTLMLPFSVNESKSDRKSS